MAAENPTAGPRVVPVHLAQDQAEILRDELFGWLAGIEEDLDTGRLADPGGVNREGDAFRRLLVALDTQEIELPDEAACSALGRAAEGYDAASGYRRVLAVHDAHHAMLAILTGEEGR